MENIEELSFKEKYQKGLKYVQSKNYDKGKIYLGEYTFTPCGCARYYFIPREFNNLMLKFYNDKKVDINLIHRDF